MQTQMLQKGAGSGSEQDRKNYANIFTGFTLWLCDDAQETGFHGAGNSDAGAGDWREYGDF